MTSDYDLAMGQDQECQFLCTHEADRKAVRRARQLIEDGYVSEWIVDNLPGATSFVTVDKSHKYYAAGFKIGSKDFSPTSQGTLSITITHLSFDGVKHLDGRETVELKS